ncbi:MAG: hypothetical protein RMI93_00025 [Caldimicrobium sp.]|nr:hypothetical protein [Caldimicrobium sp.]MDW8181983.1 hypothetical protein [Caldimicrobium sp.]
MSSFSDYLYKKQKISVIGLGYVRLPLAVKLARIQRVVRFDVNHRRIEELKKGVDISRKISPEELKEVSIIEFSSEPDVLKTCSCIIFAVTTPVDKLKNPKYSYLKEARMCSSKNH